MPVATKQQRKRTYNIHDIVFFLYVTRAGCLIPLLRHALGDQRASMFDWDSVHFEDTRKVEADLGREYRYDLVVSADMRVAKRLCEIAILIEHKSYWDPDLMKQLMGYQAVHYAASSVPMVPVVIYHGPARLVDLRSFQDTLEYGDDQIRSVVTRLFGDELVQFRVLFVNLNELAQTAHLLDPALDCMVHTMANIHDFTWDQMHEMLVKTTRIVDSVQLKEVKMLSLVYNNRVNPGKFDMKDIAALERDLEPDPDRRVLSDTESIEDIERYFGLDKYYQGIEEGREEGRQQTARENASRMLASGFDLDQICFVTELSRSEVKMLRDH